MRMPRFGKCVSELPARFYEKRRRSHSKITNFQVENLRWRRSCTKLLKNGCKGCFDNWPGQAAGCVMRTALPAFIRGLEDHCALWNSCRRDRGSDLPLERWHKILDGLGRFQSIRCLAHEFLIRFFSESFDTLIGRSSQQLLQIYCRWRAVLLGWLDRYRLARGNL